MVAPLGCLSRIPLCGQPWIHRTSGSSTRRIASGSRRAPLRLIEHSDNPVTPASPSPISGAAPLEHTNRLCRIRHPSCGEETCLPSLSAPGRSETPSRLEPSRWETTRETPGAQPRCSLFEPFFRQFWHVGVRHDLTARNADRAVHVDFRRFSAVILVPASAIVRRGSGHVNLSASGLI